MIEKNKKKKNRIILCLCSIFVLVASIFSFVPLIKESKIVKADTVTSDYSFSGSNISSKTTFNGSITNNLFYFPNDFNNTYDGLDVTYDKTTQYYTLNGQSSYSPWIVFNFDTPFTIKAGTYTFSTDRLSGNYEWNGFSLLYLYYNNGTDLVHELWTLGSSCTITFVSDVTIPYFVIAVSDANFYDNYVFGFQIEKGTNHTSWQPYSDSTYLNYDFDIVSKMNFDTNLTNIDLSFNINNNLNFTRVGNGNHSYNYGNTYTFSTDVKGLLFSLTFSAIDLSSNVLNNDYIFKLYLMVDYNDANENYVPSTFFNANIGSIVLGSYKDFNTYFRNQPYTNDDFIEDEKYNFISYIDTNGNNLNIFIPLDSSISSDYWQFRTYYTSLASSDTSGAYNNGYNVGYNTGYGKGEQDGYNSGYNSGTKVGYNNGYNAGVQAGNDYTFLALVSSVIDAPMAYFTSLFNFELLGVNLQGFLMALFTLCVVVTIVKLCLGR